MMKSFRLFAALLLLALLATPRTRAQATNLPARANSTFGVNTNGVVKVPATNVYWPTQNLRINAATVTNLAVGTISGIDAIDIPTVHGTWSTNNVQAALLDLAADIAAVDVSNYLAKSGGTMSGAINMGVNNLTNVNYLAFDAVSGAAENSLYVNATEDLVYLRGSGSASPGTASILVMSTDGLVSPYDLKQVGATGGQVLAWDAAVDGRWEPLSLATVATTGSAADLSGTLDIARLADGSVTAAKLAVQYLPLAGGTMSGTVNMGGYSVTNASRFGFSTGTALGNDGMENLIYISSTGNTNLVISSATGLLNPGTQMEQIGATSGQVLTWSGAAWAPATVSAGIAGGTGSTDNLALRADGAGGATLQSSDLSIEDVSTSTTNNLQLKNNHSGQTNSSLVLTPKGSGAFILGTRPDGGTGGGAARGSYAVDLQWNNRSNANQVSAGQSSSLLGGERNRITGNWSVIGGGYGNTALTGDFTFVGGGSSNASSGTNAAIAGGESNAASGSRSGVGAGYNNTASGANSYVGGGGTGSAGNGNTASGTGSAVLGGSLNTATQSYTASLGGINNNITATYGAGLGGDNADVSASYALAGGRETLADQTYGVALGYYADTDHQAGLTLAGGRVAATGDSQTALTPARVQTTTATPTSLYLDGSSVRWTVASGVSYACTVQVVGRSSGGESAAYWFQCLVENNGGTTTLIGGGTATTSFEDNAAWDCAITADDTNDALQVTVTGAAATTITWSATILSTKAK